MTRKREFAYAFSMPRRTLPKKALTKARRSVRDLVRGFELLSDHVVITDSDGRIVYANSAASKNTGYSIDEMLGKNPGDLWGGQMPKEFYRELWQRIKIDKKPFIGEMKNKRKDGTLVWQEVRISPVLGPDGEAAYFIGIEPAISDRKQSEEFREQLLSVIGHDSLSPATAISWILEGLLERGKFSKQDRKELHEVYSQNKRVISMIDQLLYLAAKGKGHPSRERVDIVQLTDAILAQARERFSHVKIICDRSKRTFPITTNKLMTQEALHMLITSPLSALKVGGQCAVTLTHAKDSVKLAITIRGAQRQSPLQEKLLRLIASALKWREVSHTRASEGERFTVKIPLTL